MSKQVLFLFFIFILMYIYLNQTKKITGGLNILNNIDNFYIINLDISNDRLKNIKNQNKEHKLKLTRFPAVYGKNINDKKLIEKGLLDKNHKLKKGQIGCYLSHLKLLKKAKNDNDNIIIVLEDDIVFSKNFKDKLNEYYKEVPDDWDIIYLGASRVKGKKISKHVLEGVYDKYIDGSFNMGTYAMMLNKKSINKLLKLLIPIKNPIDTTIAKNNKNLKLYYINPSIVSHNNNFKSEIHYINNKEIIKYDQNITHKRPIILEGGDNDVIDKSYYLDWNNKITDNIDKKYFINLDNSLDRKKYMDEESKSLDLNLIRFPAVYGQNVNEEKLIERRVLDKNHKLKKGELGCYLSHLNLLNKCKDDNDNIVMILEDDIEFGDNFKDKLNEYYKEVPNDWDIIYLGGSRLRGRKISEHVLKGIYDKEPKGDFNMGMYAILLNKKSINKLLKITVPIRHAIDTVVAKNNEILNIYFINPSIVHHNNDFISDIHYVNNKKIRRYTNKITNVPPIIVGEENNSLFSIPLFYLNLDNDFDRNKNFEAIIKKFNLDGSRVKAIYGKTYNRDYIVVNKKKYNFIINTKYKPNKGQIGTCLSHIKAILEFKDRNIDYGLICEDDLDFTIISKFKSVIDLNNIITEAPPDWELIKLHSSNPKILNELIDDFNVGKLYSKINPLDKSHYSMMAYIINKKYIKSFFEKYYKNGVFVFNDDYFVSDVSLLYSDNIYNYTIPIFRSKVFKSTRLNDINEFDFKSNKIINNFWTNLLKKN